MEQTRNKWSARQSRVDVAVGKQRVSTKREVEGSRQVIPIYYQVLPSFGWTGETGGAGRTGELRSDGENRE